MSDNYCESKPTRWECPICHDKLILGPEMTREDKAWARAEGKKSFRNKWKHMLEHGDEPTPKAWKKWTQDEQVQWIMATADEIADDLGVII